VRKNREGNREQSRENKRGEQDVYDPTASISYWRNGMVVTLFGPHIYSLSVTIVTQQSSSNNTATEKKQTNCHIVGKMFISEEVQEEFQ
jgi:hypothetical protein